jgi:hypothetical protein
MSNVNSTNAILPNLPHHEATIGLSLKRQTLEYHSPYLIGNVHPSLIMLTLHEIFINILL